MPGAPQSNGIASDGGLCRLRPAFGLPGLVALRLEGDVDLAASGHVEERLLSHLNAVREEFDLVLDIRGVTALSAAGTAVLTRVADRLAPHGRRLLLVVGTGPVGQALRAAHASDVLDLHPSYDTALSALSALPALPGAAGAGDGPDELGRLRKQVRDLRDKLSSRPLVARALGMLQERYRLVDMGVADDLLRRSSQQYNVRVRELAAAFVAAPPPSTPSAREWFPGRVRPPAPAVTFAPFRDACRSALLELVLDGAAGDAAATGGVVGLFDAARGGFVVERWRGLSRDLAESLWDGAVPPDAGDRITAVDVDDRSFPRDVRAALTGAGVGTVLCTPLASRSRRPVGTVLSLHPGTPRAAHLEVLRRVGAEAGAWLDWHAGTVGLDALEHLHRLARTAGTG